MLGSFLEKYGAAQEFLEENKSLVLEPEQAELWERLGQWKALHALHQQLEAGEKLNAKELRAALQAKTARETYEANFGEGVDELEEALVAHAEWEQRHTGF